MTKSNKQTKIVWALLLMAGLGIAACNGGGEQSSVTTSEDSSTTTASTDAAVDSAQNSFAFTGTFEGTLPCADCEGIKSTVVLNSDKTYQKTDAYQGGKEPSKFEEKGSFEWNAADSTILLSPLPAQTSGLNQKYKVNGDQIIMLDGEGKLVTGELADKYILKKAQ